MRQVTAWASALLLASATAATGVSADAPVGRYSVTADTVRDNITGLTWQRVVNVTTFTQPAAAAHCANLTLAGFDDWRLPTQPELESIVDDTQYSPAIDRKAFPNTPSYIFWSSSTILYMEESMRFVDFLDGHSQHMSAQELCNARCVR